MLKPRRRRDYSIEDMDRQATMFVRAYSDDILIWATRREPMTKDEYLAERLAKNREATKWPK